MRTNICLMVLLTCSACSCDPNPGSRCPPGEVLVDGSCRVICGSDEDCAADEACMGSICSAGVRTGVPVIAEVDGDGSAVSDAERSEFTNDNPGLGSLAAHHLDGGIVVTGDNLAAAQFSLSGGSGTQTLSALQLTDTNAKLALPLDIAAGHYRLSAANSVGVDQTEVFLLRGDQGPAGADGSPDTAVQVLAKLVQVDGPYSGLDADTLDGQHASDLADADMVDHLHATDIIAQAVDYRCFTVTLDNSVGAAAVTKQLDFPFDCLSPYNEGNGCWGEMFTLAGNPLGSTVYAANLRIMFTQTGGSWYVSANRGDGTATRLINADSLSIVNPIGDGGQCDLRTNTGAVKAAGAGFSNLSLVASAGRWCHLRVCEPQLPLHSAQ